MHELVPIVMFVSLFSMVFGIVYIRSKENMAMLEKGLNPRAAESKIFTQPFWSLKFGLLLVGAGLGLFLAYVLDVRAFAGVINTDPLYPALIGVGGGMGLIISYFIEKKYMDKQQKTPEN